MKVRIWERQLSRQIKMMLYCKFFSHALSYAVNIFAIISETNSRITCFLTLSRVYNYLLILICRIPVFKVFSQLTDLVLTLINTVCVLMLFLGG